MYTYPDTPQGAYDAGYYWCKEFGRPADSNENPRRGALARDTFYPKYGSYTPPADCTVRFDAQGGIAVASVTVQSGSAVGDLPASTRPGYTFGGWYSQSGGRGTRLTRDTVVTGDCVWYARWDAVLVSVLFDPCGGETDTASKAVLYGAAYGTLPAPTRFGYCFEGWFTAARGGSRITAETAVAETGEHTLYAQWTPALSYTVTYHANGGTGAPMPQKKTIGTDLTLTATQPRRSGFLFLGWAESSDALTPEYAPGGVYTKDSPAELYAVWQSQVAGDTDGDGRLTPADAALALSREGDAARAAEILRACAG